MIDDIKDEVLLIKAEIELIEEELAERLSLLMELKKELKEKEDKIVHYQFFQESRWHDK